jgi:hypothetical protein
MYGGDDKNCGEIANLKGLDKPQAVSLIHPSFVGVVNNYFSFNLKTA